MRDDKTSDEPPISYADLRDLFAFLDSQSAKGHKCDHKFTLTRRFLVGKAVKADEVIKWLGRNGAGCDCEVMFNVEQKWGELVGYEPQE